MTIDLEKQDLNEAAVEQMAMDLLGAKGYQCLTGAEVAPWRESLASPLLPVRLEAAIASLNPGLPSWCLQEVLRKVSQITAPDLISANEIFQRYLVEGVPVSFTRDGIERSARARLVDFANPDNNEFLAVRQFVVAAGSVSKRPDIVLFVNGLPLVVIELKNPASENATALMAYRQLQTYKALIPALFVYNGLLVVSDGLEALYGSLTSDFSRFTAWKGEGASQLEILVNGLLAKPVLLDMLQFFTVFEKEGRQDAQGQISVVTVKKVAAFHQRRAVNAAISSVAAALACSAEGHSQGGVVWHTQGSGKSLSMVFFSAKASQLLGNPVILVITDRNDLDDQLYDTFCAASQLLRQKPKQAETQAELKSLLKRASGGIIFSTMQKFQADRSGVFELLSSRGDIIVLVDEAHRTQYGFAAHEVADDEGIWTVYGLAKYLRDALPNAVYLAFTGTPVEKPTANTRSVFGDYIDIYDVAMSVADKATVPVYYESRLVKIELPEAGRQLVAGLDEEITGYGLDDDPDIIAARRRHASLEALVGAESRLRTVAADIVGHFEARQAALAGKGMIVCMSRPIAARLYAMITALRPDWHDPDLARGSIKAVMTAASGDGPELAAFHTTKAQRKALALRMKNPADPLRLVIVCDMWLTGFDVPCLHTMYLDKRLQGHNLMQAIARVNRVFGDKPGGLVVDYLGIAQDLKEAMAVYGDAGGAGDPALSQGRAVNIMLEKLDIIEGMLRGSGWEAYFAAPVSGKLALILEVEDFILGIEDGKKRFSAAVNGLAAAHALAMPAAAAMALSPKVAFFQAVLARLRKFEPGAAGGGPERDFDTAIRQIVDKALVSSQVVDVFGAAGIKKPDISILSDEFMQEMRDLPQRNLALETLKKLLNDEITARLARNRSQGKKLLDLLQASLRRYQNKLLTAAEIMEELIRLAKEIRASDREAAELGLTDYEYAFYLAVAENESAVELMGRERLRELAVVLTQQVRQNTSLDWTIRADIRKRLEVAIKRTLRKYGYPPDMAELATEQVVRQAEQIAQELATGG